MSGLKDYVFSNVSFDNETTVKRKVKLQELYNDYYYGNKCNYFDSCSASLRTKSSEHWAVNDWSARVGKNYDLTINGKKVRILIIGKESKNFLEKLSEPSGWWPEINRHYSITYQTLKDMFSYYPKNNNNPVLTMFTLTNVQRCAFRKYKDQTSGIPNTKEQTINCTKITQEEIKILEPTVILIQFDELSAYDLFCDIERCEGKVYYSKKAKCYILNLHIL